LELRIRNLSPLGERASISDPQLLMHLWARTEEILASPPVHHEAKVAELCQLAERNLDGLRALANKE
jgi:hypothetical protein